MDKNVDSMLSLIEDFIKVMYLESSKLNLNRTRTNIRDLLDSMVPDLKQLQK